MPETARRGAAQRPAARIRPHGRVQPGRAGRHPSLADRHAAGFFDRQPATRTTRNMRAELYPAWERSGCRRRCCSASWPRSPTVACTPPRAPARRGSPCSSCSIPVRASGWAATPAASTPGTTRTHRAKASAAYMNERMRSLNNNIELALAAANAARAAPRACIARTASGLRDNVVYSQFPGETRDYVPMVIAAAWLFLHSAPVRAGVPEGHSSRRR